MSNTEPKPQEFWVAADCDAYSDNPDIVVHGSEYLKNFPERDFVHVIEYYAYEQQKMQAQINQGKIFDLQDRVKQLEEILKETIHPLEMYQAYGWSDRNKVISKVHEVIKENK